MGLYGESGAVSLQSIAKSPINSHNFYFGGYHDKARFLRKSGNATTVQQIQVGSEFAKDASFWIVRGLNVARDTISFESVSAPGSYLYKQGGSAFGGTGNRPGISCECEFRFRANPEIAVKERSYRTYGSGVGRFHGSCASDL